MNASEYSFNPSYIGPRPDILQALSARARDILDVGCSDGTLGESILRRHPDAQVTGLEVSVEMAAIAQKRIQRVIVGDVESPSILEHIHGQLFDAIICADVLEHLRDPWTFVGLVSKHLKPGGELIASIPNIRHIDTLINLAILGRWPYRDRGIHDRTHLRFFAKRDAIELFERAGLSTRVASVNYRVIERPHPINKWAHWLAIPGVAPFLAFQYVLVSSRP